jgi:hypothetical protein
MSAFEKFPEKQGLYDKKLEKDSCGKFSHGGGGVFT